ncbi:lactonase family protein [Achromobacter sp. SIMBA_011]|uniref:lactonase family protein n=1 Tax=Achromobacter TaxID=222 RepID=UPI0021CE0908|nr:MULTISPECIES: lactonase family protein [Achromobacter]MCU6619401.1 lactonase family protein [Achromobacter mucicolens]MCZ8410911.1 lactonase family protein [Achromobacter dolens]
METQPDQRRPSGAVLYTGCRSSAARQGRGRGIAVFALAGPRQLASLGEQTTPENPSYLAFGLSGRVLYAVHGDGTTVSAYQAAEDGGLAPIGRRDCGGRNPVHLLVSRSGRWLMVANYATGTLSALPILADGALGPVASSLALPGDAGPHRTQQTGAHPHQLVYHPASDWIAVPDKGTDAIHTVRIDEATGALQWQGNARLPAGSGPRHLVFSPDGATAWITLELSSQVLAAAVCPDSGTFTPTQRLSTLPDTYTGDNTAAGIVLLSDDRLFVSNRGHGSVVAFSVQGSRMTSPRWYLTHGTIPRFITATPDQQRLLVANEDSDVIECLDGTGPLQPIVHTGSPVCIVFKPGVSA